MRRDTSFPVFAITNPNKPWVCEEIDKLLAEWRSWCEYCEGLGDSPDYDPESCSEAIKDGHANRRKHEILREKTLVFMRNHFSGAEFVLSGWPRHPHENSGSRLRKVVPVWVQRLEVLKASMAYVRVPDGFWKGRGKDFLEQLSKSSAEGAIEVATSFLKNPLGE